jgi:hypothetical protein
LRRLLIQQATEIYRFLQFEFRDGADGSLNIVFDRKPLGTERSNWNSLPDSERRKYVGLAKEFRISYHATGRVNFHNADFGSIFCEPTFAISRPQQLLTVSVPSIDKLTSAAPELAREAVIHMDPRLSGRVTFAISLVPDGFEFQESPLALIGYQGWFGIAVCFGELPFPVPSDLQHHILKVVPSVGRHLTQVLRQDQALISVHQKREGRSGLIYEWEPNEGVYRVIFSVPMRIKPRLRVEFADSSIHAEEMPASRRTIETAEIRFRAVGKGGYLRTPQVILSIELDAEL